MTTIETANFRRIEADTTGFEVTCTASDTTLHVALNPEERRTLAAALTADQGGQWTREIQGALWAAIRDELRREYPSSTDYDHRKLDIAASASVDAVIETLDAHHPRPDGTADTDVMRRAARSERTAERHFPADQLAQGADTIDSLRAQLDRMERERDAARAEVSRIAREMARRVAAQRSDYRDAASQHHWLTLQRDEARRERDAAVERAEQAEREISTWRTSTESAHSDFLQAAHDRDLWKDSAEYAAGERDEWMSRAEQAERELKPSSPLRQQADAWMRIVNHPAISRALREKNRSYSDQVFERITWLFEAAEDARESNPVSAVSRADIEKAIRVRPWGTGGPDSQGYEILHVESAVDAVCDLLGIEAEQAVDQVEERVDALADAVYGDELVTEQMRGVLERLVRSGWILPEGVECK